jgi:hypothetical protein
MRSGCGLMRPVGLMSRIQGERWAMLTICLPSRSATYVTSKSVPPGLASSCRTGGRCQSDGDSWLMPLTRRTHAKCMRTTDTVREYFKRYRLMSKVRSWLVEVGVREDPSRTFNDFIQRHVPYVSPILLVLSASAVVMV